MTMHTAVKHMLLHNGNKTAADYIQNGLIAHFDGIENVGFGLHSDTSLIWKNLGSLGSQCDAARASGMFLADGAIF